MEKLQVDWQMAQSGVSGGQAKTAQSQSTPPHNLQLIQCCSILLTCSASRSHLVPCDCPMVGSLCPGLWALKPAQAPKPTAQQPQPCSSSKGSLYFLGESKGAHWGRGAGLRGHTLETLTREASPQFQTLNGWLALSDPAWSPRRTSQHLLLGSFRGCRHPPPKTKARPWQL